MLDSCGLTIIRGRGLMDPWGMVQWLGNSLNPLTVVIQMLLWGVTGAVVCRGLMRRRLVSREATIHKLEKDVQYWEGLYAQSEERNRKVLDRAEKGEAQSISSVLARASAELREGNEERAASPILGWFESESTAVARASAMAAEWVLSFAGENEGEAIRESVRFGEMAVLLDPSSKIHKTMLANLSALKGSYNAGGTRQATNDRPWEKLNSYVDEPSLDEAEALRFRAGKAFEEREYFLALALFRRSWVIFRRIADISPTIALAEEINVANCLHNLGRSGEAFDHLNFAFPSLKKVAGPDDEKTLLAQSALGEVLLGLEKPAEALPHLEHAAGRTLAMFGEEHRDTLDSYEKLGRALLALGRTADAEPICRRVIKGYGKIWGAANTRTSFTTATLAHVLGELGRREEASQMILAQALSMEQTGQPDGDRFAFEAFVSTLLQEWSIPVPINALPLVRLAFDGVAGDRRGLPLNVGSLEFPWAEFSPEQIDGAKSGSNLGR